MPNTKPVAGSIFASLYEHFRVWLYSAGEAASILAENPARHEGGPEPSLREGHRLLRWHPRSFYIRMPPWRSFVSDKQKGILAHACPPAFHSITVRFEHFNDGVTIFGLCIGSR